MITERHITRVIQALSMGADIDSIREKLLQEGFAEHEVYLCVKAAEVSIKLDDQEVK